MAIQYDTRKFFWKSLWTIIAAVLIYLGVQHGVFHSILEFVGIVNEEAQPILNWAPKETQEEIDEFEALGYE